MRRFAPALAAALLALAASWTTAVTVTAQWEPWPMKNVPRLADGKVDMKGPPRRTPDGKIDLQGFWLPTNPVKHLLNLAADLKPSDVPLQPWAEKALQEAGFKAVRFRLDLRGLEVENLS